jgi:hypothetical protein
VGDKEIEDIKLDVLQATRGFVQVWQKNIQSAFGSLFSFGSGLTNIAELLYLFCTFVFQSAAVTGRRNNNSTPAQSPVRCLQV